MGDADLSDAEIDYICKGYVQGAAKVRFLKKMGLIVRRKADGNPLVNRAHYDAVMGCTAAATSAGAKHDNQPVWGVH